jgi:hypothetical protein
MKQELIVLNGNYSNEIIIKSSGDNQKLEMISELVL